MKRVGLWVLCAGFVLTILGAKLQLIATAGSDLPTWDQWDAISDGVLRPWAEHRLAAADLLTPHNEHRLVTTKLYSFALAAANGQWSSYVETTTNAAVHAACALILLLLGRRWLAGRHLIAFGALVLAFMISPFAWENTLNGFQVQFYFLLLFSLGHIGLSLRHERFGLGWGLGQLCGVLAIVSMASGFLSSAAMLAVLGWQLLRTRRLSRQRLVTAALAGAFVVAGWVFRCSFPPHDPLKAHGIGDFLLPLAQLASWPGPFWLPWVFAPALWSIYRWLRQRCAPAADPVLAALFVWSGLQAAALAYGRGGGGYVLSSRYLDLLLLSVSLGYVFLVRNPPPRLRGPLTGLWLGLVVLGLGLRGVHEYQAVIAPSASNHTVQEQRVRAYVRNGDLTALAGKTWPDIPYPNATALTERLDSPALRQLLPPSARPAVPLTAGGRAVSCALPAPLAPAETPLAASTYAPDSATQIEWKSPVQSSGALPLLRFQIAGDLGRPGAQLSLVVKSANGSVPVVPETAPGLRWKFVTIARPSGPWTVEARDNDPQAWFAFTEPVEVGWLSWLAEKLLKHAMFFAVAGPTLLIIGLGCIAWPHRPRHLVPPRDRRAVVAAFLVLLGGGAVLAGSLARAHALDRLRHPPIENPRDAENILPGRLRGSPNSMSAATDAVPVLAGHRLWCGTWIEGDAFTGTIETTPFAMQAGTLTVPLLGYPTGAGNQLLLELTDASSNVVATFAYAGASPGEQPGAWRLEIPGWRGRNARLVLRDGSPDPFGWLAVGRPTFRTVTGVPWLYGLPLNVGWFVVSTAALLTLLFLPGLGLQAWLGDRARLDVATLAVPGLLLTAGLGLAVWILPDDELPLLALGWSGGYFAAAAWLAQRLWRTGIAVGRTDVVALVCYGAVVIAALAFAVFPPAVAQEFLGPSRARMIAAPPDHRIPNHTANYIAAHYDGVEERVAYFGEDWAITSRGPLAPLGIAAAFALLGELPGERHGDVAWPADDTGFYVARIFGILTNALVVLGAAGLARQLAGAAGASRTLVWLASAPLVAIHTDFLWPKLLATFFLCLALTSLCARRPIWHAAVWTALAYLSHPVGGLFTPVIVLFALFQPAEPAVGAGRLASRVSVSRAATFIGALLLSLLPWLVYKLWVGWPESMLRYPLGDGRGFALADNLWTWLRCRWDNLWFTFVPGSFYLSDEMRSWLEGPLNQPLRWAIGYAKSLPGSVGLGCYVLLVGTILRRPATPLLARFRSWLLGGGAAVLLFFWGFSSDGLGRNCLEPLAVLAIVYTASRLETETRLLRWLVLLAACENLSVRIIGVVCAPQFNPGELDGLALAAAALVIVAALSPAIGWLLSAATVSPATSNGRSPLGSN